VVPLQWRPARSSDRERDDVDREKKHPSGPETYVPATSSARRAGRECSISARNYLWPVLNGRPWQAAGAPIVQHHEVRVKMPDDALTDRPDHGSSARHGKNRRCAETCGCTGTGTTNKTKQRNYAGRRGVGATNNPVITAARSSARRLPLGHRPANPMAIDAAKAAHGKRGIRSELRRATSLRRAFPNATPASHGKGVGRRPATTRLGTDRHRWALLSMRSRKGVHQIASAFRFLAYTQVGHLRESAADGSGPGRAVPPSRRRADCADLLQTPDKRRRRFFYRGYNRLRSVKVRLCDRGDRMRRRKGGCSTSAEAGTKRERQQRSSLRKRNGGSRQGGADSSS